MTTLIAVDGGNSKTDVALLDASGRLLAAVRGPSVSHQAVGLETGMARLAGLVAIVRRDADTSDQSEVAVLALAGADTPADVRLLRTAIDHLGLAARVQIRHDTEAVLRAGSDRSWGVAIICGAGVAASGATADGRTARLDALGPISGDWGGGNDIGWEGVAAAVRARDRRGRPTRLARDVPAHFGIASPAALTRAFYRGQVSESRIGEISPIVFAAAMSGDAVARAIVDRMADEVVAMARAMLTRLHLRRSDPDVVLGGGVFRTDDAAFYERIRAGIADIAPRARVIRLRVPPVAGAALLALDMVAEDARRTPDAAQVRDALADWDRRTAQTPLTVS